MEIKLDREKRVVLLKAINQGSIDSYILNQWIDHAADNMTIEEINAEIVRLERFEKNDQSTCRLFQAAGLCLMMNRDGT